MRKRWVIERHPYLQTNFYHYLNHYVFSFCSYLWNNLSHFNFNLNFNLIFNLNFNFKFFNFNLTFVSVRLNISFSRCLSPLSYSLIAFVHISRTFCHTLIMIRTAKIFFAYENMKTKTKIVLSFSILHSITRGRLSFKEQSYSSS